MMPAECPYERDVVDAVTTDGWRGGPRADLVAHVAACEVCRDVVVVARAVRGDYDRAAAEARVPPAGLVWWRAQLRARREGAETAGRPITYVQVFAGSVAAGLLFMLGGLLWPWLRASVGVIDSFASLAELGRPWVPFALAVGGWLILAPLLLVLALSDD